MLIKEAAARIGIKYPRATGIIRAHRARLARSALLNDIQPTVASHTNNQRPAKKSKVNEQIANAYVYCGDASVNS